MRKQNIYLTNRHTERSQKTQHPNRKQNSSNYLRRLKQKGGISEEKYKKMYPTGAGSPKFYGLPKIHKQDTPLRPIVSSTGTVSYNTSKGLANILKSLVGWTTHHLINTKDFIQQIKDVKLLPDETIIFYDIKALFTSVPIQPVINIIKNKLENDKDLKTQNIHECGTHHKSVGILPQKLPILCSKVNIMSN